MPAIWPDAPITFALCLPLLGRTPEYLERGHNLNVGETSVADRFAMKTQPSGMANMPKPVTRFSHVATLAFALSTLVSGAAVAQDAAQQPGCTTTNGVSVGADCKSDAAASPEATTENGMPATKHQEEVLGADKNAAQGQNMDATGAGGAELPATQHQQDVIQKPGSSEGQQKQPGQ